MSIVALVKCESYDPNEVRKSLRRALDYLELPRDYFQAGEKVLMKPNLLSGAHPDKAVTTHPSVFQAVGEWLLEQSVDLVYGDSPAVVSPEYAAGKSEIKAAAGRLNIPMEDFKNGSEVAAPDGALLKRFPIAHGVLNADSIVSISKMKTHSFTLLTGAVKNSFGCIPGFRKATYHAVFPDPFDFSRMLVELTRLLKPKLHVMDAVTAMEGNGPGGGAPRSVNVLLASLDPVAIDKVACRIMGMKTEKVPVLAWAEKLLPETRAPVTLKGDPIELFEQKNFELPVVSPHSKDSFLVKLFRNFIVSRPVIQQDKCSKCLQCVNVCPVNPKALAQTKSGAVPVYHYDDCIRCFCCQEVCPEAAIRIKTPFLGRLLT